MLKFVFDFDAGCCEHTLYSSALYSAQSLAMEIAKASLYSKSKFFFAIFVLLVLNHAEGVDEIRGLPRYGIDTECRMESSHKGCMESS